MNHRNQLIAMATAGFVAGSFAQMYWDKRQIRKRVPELMERHLPDSAKLRAAYVHNLHMEEWSRSIHEVVEIYLGYLEDQYDAEELERRVDAMANSIDDRFKFIKTVVMY